jgi:hypothetical protein
LSTNYTRRGARPSRSTRRAHRLFRGGGLCARPSTGTVKGAVAFAALTLFLSGTGQALDLLGLLAEVDGVTNMRHDEMPVHSVDRLG